MGCELGFYLSGHFDRLSGAFGSTGCSVSWPGGRVALRLGCAEVQVVQVQGLGGLAWSSWRSFLALLLHFVEFLDLGRGHRREGPLRAADELDATREGHDAEVHPGRRIVGHVHPPRAIVGEPLMTLHGAGAVATG